MSGIEVDEGRDIFPSAVFIDRISVMGGIHEEFFNTELRQICFHGEKRMQKREHIMAGSPFQKRKYRKIAVRIGGHIHVEVVTEEIAFPVGVPSPAAVRLRITAFAAAGRTAFFLTIADPFFSLLRSGTDRGTVTGKSQMVWIDQSFLNRTIHELLMIKPKDEKKRIFRFQLPVFQQREKFGCGNGRIAGSFLTFPFPFGWLYFRETVFWGKVVPVILPDAGKEIIKSPNTGSIPERETAEDGIKRSFSEHAAPDSNRSYLQLQSKQIGAQHTGREPGLRAKNRVTFLHNGISQGEIQIPELYDIIPGAFGKYKGIGIKFQKIGYESILIGGMAARIIR